MTKPKRNAFDPVERIRKSLSAERLEKLGLTSRDIVRFIYVIEKLQDLDNVSILKPGELEELAYLLLVKLDLLKDPFTPMDLVTGKKHV